MENFKSCAKILKSMNSFDMAEFIAADHLTRVQNHFGRHLLRPEDCENPVRMERFPRRLRSSIQATVQWFQEEWAPRLETSGPVYFVMADPEQPETAEDLEFELRRLGRMFRALAPVEQPDSEEHTLVALFRPESLPELRGAQSPVSQLVSELRRMGIVGSLRVTNREDCLPVIVLRGLELRTAMRA